MFIYPENTCTYLPLRIIYPSLSPGYLQIVIDTLCRYWIQHVSIQYLQVGIQSLCVGIIYVIPTNKSVGMMAVCNQKYLHIPTGRFTDEEGDQCPVEGTVSGGVGGGVEIK